MSTLDMAEIQYPDANVIDRKVDRNGFVSVNFVAYRVPLAYAEHHIYIQLDANENILGAYSMSGEEIEIKPRTEDTFNEQ